jgi:hypothetical protein
MNVVSEFAPLLIGKDLRNVHKNSIVVQAVQDQPAFDELFRLMFCRERSLVIRAADAVEKITRMRKDFLRTHKDQLLAILKSADHKELKSHAIGLIPRIELTPHELRYVWHTLTYLALNRHATKSVRVSALQALSDISSDLPEHWRGFQHTIYAM